MSPCAPRGLSDGFVIPAQGLTVTGSFTAHWRALLWNGWAVICSVTRYIPRTGVLG
jgi:hypothetical protein